MTWPDGARPPVAVVFDCDGTLVDTETVTRGAIAASLADVGIELTDALFARMLGHPWPRTRALMQAELGMDDAAVAAYRAGMARRMPDLLDDPGLVFPDAVVVLDVLAERGVPVAVCTSSGRDHLRRVLELPGLRGRFAVQVAREDTAEHKPSAVPYLEAVSRLADHVASPLAPSASTVVEDSGPGVAAGVAAGCRTVAVDRGAGLHDLSAAHAVVERLTASVLAHPPARSDGGTGRGTITPT